MKIEPIMININVELYNKTFLEERHIAIDIIHEYCAVIMNGGSVKIEHKQILDRLVKLLEKKEHAGIVLTGSNPWYVRIVKLEPKKVRYRELQVGKYYKVYSTVQYNYNTVDLNERVVYVFSETRFSTFNFYVCDNGFRVGSDFGVPTYLQNNLTYFVEVEKPEEFNLAFVDKNIIYPKCFKQYHFYKCLNGLYENQILFVTFDSIHSIPYNFELTLHSYRDYYNEVPHVEVICESWKEV